MLELRIPDTTAVPPLTTMVTVALDNVHPDEAYRQGWWAFSFGLEREANPYINAEVGESNWQEGWHDALLEDEG